MECAHTREKDIVSFTVISVTKNTGIAMSFIAITKDAPRSRCVVMSKHVNEEVLNAIKRLKSNCLISCISRTFSRTVVFDLSFFRIPRY